MKYIRKTRDEWTLQGFYLHPYRWEDVTSEDTYKEILARFKEYRENEPGRAFRIVFHRVKV